MADEDNFDIDIYGDLDNDTSGAYGSTSNVKKEDDDLLLDDDEHTHNDTKAGVKPENNDGDTSMGAAADNGDNNNVDSSNNHDDGQQSEVKKTNKRKYPDDRPIDMGATTALYVADLHWWTTDDDIRGWINACDCEDELKDITFSEHKVNGKSKG